jgi:serine/threonine protein kinase/tetratricopeptide (TPR) repeat protein
MSSNPISLVPGSQLQDYHLLEPIGSSTDLWKAEDTRTGSPVALKILSRSFSSNPARRQELVNELRQKAALRHPHLVSIRDIGAAGEVLFLTMELVQGESLCRIIRRGLPDRKQLFRLAYELVSALEYLHARRLVHGNVGGETVLLTRSASVKLVGLSLANLLGERGQERARRRLLDPRTVAYMAPEAIGGALDDPRSDIFSFGCVMYEALTGRPPFAGANVEEIARQVVSGQPVSPKKIRADVDADAVAIIGLCLFKDPERRPATAGELRAAILKAAPELLALNMPSVSFDPSPEPVPPPSVVGLPIESSDLLRHGKAATSRVGPPIDSSEAIPLRKRESSASTPRFADGPRDAVIWVAELANFSELETDDPSRARKSAARMHQILGEAAHLFDGTVSDDSGPRMVAEMPDASRAYQAGRKGEHDLEDILDGREPKPLVRIVLHAGELDSGNATITGEAVEEATGRLTTMPPGRLFMTETFVSRSGGTVKTERATGVPGVLYVGTVARQPTAAEVSDANATVAIQHPEKPRTTKDPAELTTVVQGGKSSRLVAAVAAILLILSAAVFWLSSHREAPAVPPAVAEDESAPTPAHPHTIALAAPVADGADPALSERAASARMAAMEILRSAPQLRVADSAGKGADLFGARVQRTAAGDEMIPLHPAGKRKIGQAFAFADAASGARSLVAWICAQLRIHPPDVSRSQEALEEFADAVAAYAAKRPAGEVDRALKASMAADPSFVPLQLFAMRIYSERRDLKRAADSARQVLSRDAGNVSALQTMARISASGGDAVSSIGYWNLSLENDPRNVAAINALGRFALAANDPAVFERAVGRLRIAGAADLGELHPPDLLVASGKIDAAVDQYYDLELKEPDNPALALKIGRISVLRHSGSIADLELKKLQTLDPFYSRHLLEAYIAAQAGQKEKAATELELAAKGAPIGGDLYTSAAEIAAMTADARGVVTNLEKALKNSEPTASYVLVDPLFGYLRSDSAFQSVRESFASQREAIKAALQRVKL